MKVCGGKGDSRLDRTIHQSGGEIRKSQWEGGGLELGFQSSGSKLQYDKLNPSSPLGTAILSQSIIWHIYHSLRQIFASDLFCSLSNDILPSWNGRTRDNSFGNGKRKKFGTAHFWARWKVTPVNWIKGQNVSVLCLWAEAPGVEQVPIAFWVQTRAQRGVMVSRWI